MRIAERMKNVPGSGTLETLSLANELEKEGKDIIHLEVGEPDFDTPKHIKDAAKKALDEGKTGYTPSSGTQELREAISQDLKRKGIERIPEEIIATPGAKHSLFTAMAVVLDPGDEILIPTPCWTYEGMTRIINTEPIFIETSEENQFKLKPESVKEKISSKTRMLLLNYPNNPTGAVLKENTLRALADLAIDHGFWILTDEVYDQLVYGDSSPNIGSFSDLQERTIYINSFSKTYAMTGWRLGYTAAPQEIISEMVKIQQSSTTCPASFVQSAGVAALEGPQDQVKEMASKYEKRKSIIVEGLNSINGINCIEPKAAFYAFPNIEDLGKDSTEISKSLLKEAGVAATPGSAFGPAGEGYIRLSYANSAERVEEALERMEENISAL